jgi:hypothetical protein
MENNKQQLEAALRLVVQVLADCESQAEALALLDRAHHLLATAS